MRCARARRRKKHLIPDRIGLCVRRKHKRALSQYNTLNHFDGRFFHMWKLLIQKYSPNVVTYKSEVDPNLPALEKMLNEFYEKVPSARPFKKVIPKLVTRYAASSAAFESQLKQDGYTGQLTDSGLQDTSILQLVKKISNKYLVASLGYWLSGILEGLCSGNRGGVRWKIGRLSL